MPFAFSASNISENGLCVKQNRDPHDEIHNKKNRLLHGKGVETSDQGKISAVCLEQKCHVGISVTTFSCSEVS
jgi:hypothetical protein